METLHLQCPNCNLFVTINKKEINCAIFRHGVYKKDFKQINPHLDKINCDLLVKNNLIFGCGAPFKIILTDGEYSLIPCEYI